MFYAINLIISIIIFNNLITYKEAIHFKDDEKTNIGLYFETLDTIKFSKNTYKLAIYIDISNYEQKYNEIQ